MCHGSTLTLPSPIEKERRPTQWLALSQVYKTPAKKIQKRLARALVLYLTISLYEAKRAINGAADGFIIKGVWSTG
jgi:hypothetical protein